MPPVASLPKSLPNTTLHLVGSCRQQLSGVMQVVRDHDYSKAADVYSFGIIMWEMMTWRLPWEELNPFQVGLHVSE